MSEPKVEFRDLWPADVSIRADAQMGAAWRRCEAAMPEGWYIREVARCSGPPIPPHWHAFAWGPNSQRRGFDADTPTAALNALADALETRDAASPTVSSTSRPDAHESRS